MLKAAIRADGGTSIGMGHIMRCLSLAKELRKEGLEVCFFSRFSSGIQKIEAEGFKAVKLACSKEEPQKGFFYGDTTALESEADEIIGFIRKYRIEFLIIDSYNVTEKYFLNLKPFVKKLGYIDDINKFIYPVDILVNGNITGEYLEYKKYYDKEILLLGPKYNLIRDEFKCLPERVTRKAVKEIMVTTGGSDPFDMSMEIIDSILTDKELKRLKINVIVGTGFENKEQLRKLREQNSNIVLYENVKKISEIMLKSDVAISAGGSTLYELCACGTPTLAFIVAGNQEELVDIMDKSGYVNSLGWYDKFDRIEFLYILKDLCKSYEKRLYCSEKMQQLVDAGGAERVAKEILKLMLNQ